MVGPPVEMDSPSSVTLTRPAPCVWVLTLERKPDNRLAPEMLNLLLTRLDEIEAEWRTMNSGEIKHGGSVVIASSSDKFWSNGFIPAFLARPGFKDEIVAPLFYRLLTYPLVTIAAVKGHCFAGGMLLALCCDYRLMSSGKGWMSMPELLIGLPLQRGYGAILRAKLPPQIIPEVMLGKRYTAIEAHAAGFVNEVVDGSADTEAVVKRAVALGQEEGPKAALGSWGGIKDGLYYWVGDQLKANLPGSYPKDEATAFFDRMERRKANL